MANRKEGNNIPRLLLLWKINQTTQCIVYKC